MASVQMRKCVYITPPYTFSLPCLLGILCYGVHVSKYEYEYSICAVAPLGPSIGVWLTEHIIMYYRAAVLLWRTA